MLGRSVALELMERDDSVQRLADGRSFGRRQMILRQADGLVAVSEPRADGLAIVG